MHTGNDNDGAVQRRRRWSELGTCAVLVHRRPTREWALPGTFLHEGERLADAVARALHDKFGLDGVTLRRLGTIDDAVADLAFDHQQIVAEAVDGLRTLYQDRPDPLGLLPQPFTLLQLRILHETILGEALQKDTFRRRMEPHLQPTERIAEGTVGRPARLFKRR